VLPIASAVCSRTDEVLVEEATHEGFIVAATVPAKSAHAKLCFQQGSTVPPVKKPQR